MRFSNSIVCLLFTILVTVMTVSAFESTGYKNALPIRNTIEAKFISEYMVKRQVAPSGTAAKNGTATATSQASPAATTKAAKKKNANSFSTPAILTDGTLFYIATSVTCLLWVSGKFIDIKLERQERYAESLVHSI